MDKSENIFFRILNIFAHFVLLNTLWIIFCVPIVTIFPATTALFGVARKWVIEGTEVGTVRLFFTLFKKNFKRSFTIGILWTIAGLILYIDFSILLQTEFNMSSLVFTLLVFSTILYAFISIYVFFIMVHYELSMLNTIKNALFLSIGYIHYTVLCLFIIGGALITTYYFPPFVMIFGSVLAFILYFIFHSLTIKIAKVKEFGKANLKKMEFSNKG